MPPLTVNAHVVDASAPATGGDDAPLRERPTVGPGTDFPPLEQTIIELDPGADAQRASDDARGGSVRAQRHRLARARRRRSTSSSPRAAPTWPRARTTASSNTGTQPLTLISVRIPDPDTHAEPGRRRSRHARGGPPPRRPAGRRPPRPTASSGSSPTPPRACAPRPTSSATSRPPARPTTFTPTTRSSTCSTDEGVLHAQGNEWRRRAGLVHPASRARRALPAEHGRSTDARRRRVPAGRLAGGRLLPRRNAGSPRRAAVST